MDTKEKFIKSTIPTKKINFHANHRQRVRKRFNTAGAETFEDHELLELLLFYAIPQANTNETAHIMLRQYGNLYNIFNAPIRSLTDVTGIGETSAVLLKLIPEFIKRVKESKHTNRIFIGTRIEAEEFLKPLMETFTNELLYILCLSPTGELVNYHCIDGGGYSKVEVQIRSLTDFILRNNCERIIIAHNHPYSHANPSDDDIAITNRLCSSCILNDIDVLDHIIVSPYNIFSFARAGIIDEMKKTICASLNYGQTSSKYQRFCDGQPEFAKGKRYKI